MSEVNKSVDNITQSSDHQHLGSTPLQTQQSAHNQLNLKKGASTLKTKDSLAKQTTKKRDKEEQQDAEDQPQSKSFFSCPLDPIGDKKPKVNSNELVRKAKHGCNVCKSQIQDGESFAVKKVRNMAYYTQTQQEGGPHSYIFYDLIKDLIPNPEHPKERMIKGCQIFLPETVFFKDG
jgi:hypothetical protein